MPKIRKLSAEESVRAEQEDQALRAEQAAESHTQQGDTLDERYPSLSAWINGGGWIEIGSRDYSNSFIRVLDTGGMLWEGEIRYASLDDALDAADMALARLEEDGEL